MVLSACFVLLVAGCTQGSGSGSGSPSTTSPTAVPSSSSPTPDGSIDPALGIDNIDHVIVVVQENRSFDHYFGTFPGADGLPRDDQERCPQPRTL